MKKYYLGIDVGSTTVKGYLIDEKINVFIHVMLDIIRMLEKQF